MKMRTLTLEQLRVEVAEIITDVRPENVEIHFRKMIEDNKDQYLGYTCCKPDIEEVMAALGKHGVNEVGVLMIGSGIDGYTNEIVVDFSVYSNFFKSEYIDYKYGDPIRGGDFKTDHLYNTLTKECLYELIMEWEQDMNNNGDVRVKAILGEETIPYRNGLHMVQSFLANIIINGRAHRHGYEWDCGNGCIISSWDDKDSGRIKRENRILDTFLCEKDMGYEAAMKAFGITPYNGHAGALLSRLHVDFLDIYEDRFHVRYRLFRSVAPLLWALGEKKTRIET